MAPPKRPWFRFYVEAVHDPKLRSLPADTRWLFVACLAAARQSTSPGYLLISESIAMSPATLADFAGMDLRQVKAGIDRLTAVGVLGCDDQGVWFVTKWAERQYESDSSADRTAKWRRGDGDVTAVVTPPESETENRDRTSSSSSDLRPELAELLTATATREAAGYPDIRNVPAWITKRVESLADGLERDHPGDERAQLGEARRMAGVRWQVIAGGVCDNPDCSGGMLPVETDDRGYSYARPCPKCSEAS